MKTFPLYLNIHSVQYIYSFNPAEIFMDHGTLSTVNARAIELIEVNGCVNVAITISPIPYEMPENRPEYRERVLEGESYWRDQLAYEQAKKGQVQA